MELNRFKQIVRHIACHELPESQSKWFRMEDRCKLRRLAMLRIKGHQPAIAGFCNISPDEFDDITDAIIKQKTGTNAKDIKMVSEYREQRGDQETIRVKKATITEASCVKWKRNKINITADADDDTLTVGNSIMPSYSTRMITCNQCGVAQETTADAALQRLRQA